jgi:hypothetical protein
MLDSMESAGDTCVLVNRDTFSTACAADGNALEEDINSKNRNADILLQANK